MRSMMSFGGALANLKSMLGRFFGIGYSGSSGTLNVGTAGTAAVNAAGVNTDLQLQTQGTTIAQCTHGTDFRLLAPLNLRQNNIFGNSRNGAVLGGNTNDYAPGAGVFQRWSASTPINITGFSAGTDLQFHFIWNVGANTITLTNQDAASAAANRWLTTTGANLALAANKVALAQYDGTTAAWRVTLLP